MAYTTLATIKAHLNIETAYTDDDTLITQLIEVVELAIREYCCWTDEEYPDEDIPATVKHSALLLAAHLYTNRTMVSFAQALEIPYSFKFLLNPYRNHTVA